jgi:hypothetical protein
MEIADVRRRVVATIDRAKRAAVERRERNDEAVKQYDAFLRQIAIPLFRQVANVLKTERFSFTVFTPADSVRLMSDRNGEDFIELFFETSGETPRVVGRTGHARGRRVTTSERPIADKRVDELTEEDVLTFVLAELQPLVER